MSPGVIARSYSWLWPSGTWTSKPGMSSGSKGSSRFTAASPEAAAGGPRSSRPPGLAGAPGGLPPREGPSRAVSSGDAGMSALEPPPKEPSGRVIRQMTRTVPGYDCSSPLTVYVPGPPAWATTRVRE